MRTHAGPPAPGRPLRTLHAALVVGSIVGAVIAGCGGGKPADTGATPAGSSSTPSSPSPAPTPAPGTPTPTPAAAPTADLGPKVFAQRCALCHGPEGRGDGPGAAALKPKPRNLHDQAYMATRTDAELLEVIHKGKGAMPRWEGVISEAEIQAVFAHVRELGKKP